MRYSHSTFAVIFIAILSGISPVGTHASPVQSDSDQSSTTTATAPATDPAATTETLQRGESRDPAVAPAEVYIIREKSFKGGARSVWIAANDKVIASLKNGSHVRLTLDQMVNSINAVQGKAGFAYLAVDGRAGETIYAKIKYADGTLSEISAEEGRKLLEKTKTIPLLGEHRHNDAYDNLLVNPEVLNLGLVSAQAEPISADAETAVISFYRPGKLIAQIPFSFWNQDGYAASLYGGQYVQLRVAPGSHRYVGFSERLSVLELNVEAGKEYAVEFDVGMGWNQAHIKLLPLDTVKQATKIDGWKQNLSLVGVDREALANEKSALRVAAGFSYLKENQEKWLSEEAVRRSNTDNGKR